MLNFLYSVDSEGIPVAESAKSEGSLGKNANIIEETGDQRRTFYYLLFYFIF